jgi:hypothetical protein
VIDRMFAPNRVVTAFAASWLAASASAQTNVGAGPLTSVLPDSEPARTVWKLGSLSLAPGVQVRELGWDSNVFDEVENPKPDYVISATPDAQIYFRAPRVRLTGYTGVDLAYYKTYSTERSASDQYRGRMDVLLGTFRPFVGVGYVNARTKPNGEISVRADRFDSELSGGLAFEVSPISRFWASASRVRTHYNETEDFEGVELDDALNRDQYTYAGGLQTSLTPLTMLTVSGSYAEDRFQSASTRDGEAIQVLGELIFAPQAAMRGIARFGFKDLDPDDPEVSPYRGPVWSASLEVPLANHGRFTGMAIRDTQYSFDEADAYYIENSYQLSYTHYIMGDFDVQGRAGWSGFDYGQRVGGSDRRDTLTTWLAAVGYNLRNQTRMAVQYEWARRRSDEIADRNYDRRRVYFSWTFAL